MPEEMLRPYCVYNAKVKNVYSVGLQSVGMILYPAQSLSFPELFRNKFRIPGFSRVFQDQK